MMVNTLIALYLNSYWSGKMIGYSFKQQIQDIRPSFVLALAVGTSVYCLNFILFVSPVLLFLIQLLFGAFITIFLCEITKLRDYLFIKELLMEKRSSIKNILNEKNR